MDDGVDAFHRGLERTGFSEVAAHGGGAGRQVEVSSDEGAAVEPGCGQTWQQP